jgi:glycosyltransferase involved in cell wall biosynthesis
LTLTKQEITSKPELGPLVVAGIPAFNEERTIAKLIIDAQKYADVVLVCDDGSSDATAEIATRMGASVYTHKKNMGYGAATKSLFLMARDLNADVLITLDGDGQHDPRDIPKLIKPVLDKEADIVCGSRFIGKEKNGVPKARSWGIKLITKLSGAASNHKMCDAQCGFRVFGKRAISELRFIENGMGASVELLINAKKQGMNILEVATECNYEDLERNSTQNPLGQLANVLMSILRLTIEERPLLMLGVPGLIFLLAGAGFGIWMLQIYVNEQQIVTNVALAAIAFVMMGMFVLFTSITLYAISRQSQKNGN